MSCKKFNISIINHFLPWNENFSSQFFNQYSFQIIDFIKALKIGICFRDYPLIRPKSLTARQFLKVHKVRRWKNIVLQNTVLHLKLLPGNSMSMTHQLPLSVDHKRFIKLSKALRFFFHLRQYWTDIALIVSSAF